MQNDEISKPLILLVDDDRLVLATLGKGLSKAGYKVLEASSGDEAVRLCRERRPDLAILDIRMPGMTGIEAACRLWDDHQVPFMIFSAYSESDLVQESVERGALGYLVKPLDVPKVIPAIEAALRRAAQIHKLQETEDQLNVALSMGRETSTAVGVLMERYQLNSEQAFEMLRGQARSQRRKLAEVAREIVEAADKQNTPRQ